MTNISLNNSLLLESASLQKSEEKQNKESYVVLATLENLKVLLQDVLSSKSASKAGPKGLQASLEEALGEMAGVDAKVHTALQNQNSKLNEVLTQLESTLYRSMNSDEKKLKVFEKVDKALGISSFKKEIKNTLDDLNMISKLYQSVHTVEQGMADLQKATANLLIALQESTVKTNGQGLQDELKNALSAMEGFLQGLQVFMLKNESVREKEQATIGTSILNQMLNNYKDLIKKINKIKHEIAEAKKKAKVMKWVGRSVAVAGIAFGIATGQYEIAAMAATFLVLQETGQMDTIKSGIETFGENNLGMNAKEASIFADVVIIVAAMAITGGLGLGVGGLQGAGEVAAEDAAESAATDAAESAAEDAAAQSTRLSRAAARAGSMAAIGGALGMQQVNLAADIVNSIPIKNKKEKLAILIIAEVLQAALAMGITYKASAGIPQAETSENAGAFEKFMLGNRMAIIQTGTAIQGAGTLSEGALEISLGQSRMAQAKTTRELGDARAGVDILKDALGFSTDNMKSAQKFAEALTKQFGEMFASFGQYGDAMQRVAQALAR